MLEGKPSSFDEILEAREVKITPKVNIAKKLGNYNQPNPTPTKAKRQSNSRDNR